MKAERKDFRVRKAMGGLEETDGFGLIASRVSQLKSVEIADADLSLSLFIFRVQLPCVRCYR